MPRQRPGEIRTSEAHRLRRVRDELHMTQRELASHLGVAAGAIAQWETGRHTVPGPVLRLVELYELELGLGPETKRTPRAVLPTSLIARTPRTAAAAALWLLFFGTLRDGDTHPLLKQVRRAAVRRATSLVSDLRGVAMKLEQMTAFADFVLPESERAHLASLRVRGQPMTPAQVCEVFIEELGKTPRQAFARWSSEPFATASIGQVHEARLLDGRAVAVKVQYPRIVDALTLELRQVSAIDRALALFLRRQQPSGILDEISKRVLEECDYALEAERQRRFAGLFPGREDIHVPAVIPELSTRRILTSELVSGTPVETFAAQADDAARARTGAAILDFYIHSALEHGVFNADTNPANLLFEPGRVHFLDFGRVKQFSPGFVAQLRGLMRAVLERDRARARELLIQMGAVPDPDGFDFERMFRGLVVLCRPYLQAGPFTFDAHRLRLLWRTFVQDNPNLSKMRFTPDLVFLNQFHFGVSAVLAKLRATVAYRDQILDVVYARGEPRPSPYTDAELAFLNGEVDADGR